MISRSPDATVRLLQQTMGKLSVKATVVANNMGHVDTPGYRAMRAKFSEALDRAHSMKPTATEPGHLGFEAPARPVPQLVQAPVERMRLDGNTVDLDQEMTELSMVRGKYNATAQMVRKRFALLRYVAQDGR